MRMIGKATAAHPLAAAFSLWLAALAAGGGGVALLVLDPVPWESAAAARPAGVSAPAPPTVPALVQPPAPPPASRVPWRVVLMPEAGAGEPRTVSGTIEAPAGSAVGGEITLVVRPEGQAEPWLDSLGLVKPPSASTVRAASEILYLVTPAGDESWRGAVDRMLAQDRETLSLDRETTATDTRAPAVQEAGLPPGTDARRSTGLAEAAGSTGDDNAPADAPGAPAAAAPVCPVVDGGL